MSDCFHQLKLANGATVSVSAEECPVCSREEIKKLRAENDKLDTELRVAKAEVMENEDVVLSLIRRREEYRYDAERLANFIKRAQRLGIFTGHTMAQKAMEVIDLHQRVDWDEDTDNDTAQS